MAKKDDDKGTAPLAAPVEPQYEVTFTAISDGSGGLRRQYEIVPGSELRDLARLLEIGAVRAVAATTAAAAE